MQSSHTLDQLDICFDDTHAVANAGLLLPATLAERLGIEQAADALVDLGERPGAAHPGRKLLTLVQAMLAGADCIDDTDLLVLRATLQFDREARAALEKSRRERGEGPLAFGQSRIPRAREGEQSGAVVGWRRAALLGSTPTSQPRGALVALEGIAVTAHLARRLERAGRHRPRGQRLPEAHMGKLLAPVPVGAPPCHPRQRPAHLGPMMISGCLRRRGPIRL